ncbi:hypothetical protein [Paenibacillus sp. JSM ZJ436]|uniref:hypothetical protein n=1 Tax=Paenibacillus sp. JSM ZJ436 TaxID=3376190 RepID=UPI0037C80C1F
MKREKLIKHICDNSIDDMISSVIKNKSDINHVIEISKDARKEFGLKVQEFIERLESI